MKKGIIAAIAVSALIVIAFFFVKNSPVNSAPVTRTGFALDTVVSITLYGPSAKNEELISECFEMLEKYENLFSMTREGSDIYKINHAHGEPVQVNHETCYLLEEALTYAYKTEGVVDPTIGAVSSLWDFHSETPSVPSNETIKEALSHVDYRAVSITPESDTVTLSDPDAMIDLGFIAKGYIADKLKETLVASGVKSGIINLGGNVLTIGNKPDGSPYQVGLQDPDSPSGTPYTSVNVSDKSVVSSGSYERTFTVDGKTYHHILDTKTGYPVDSDLKSISVITDSSLDGDALSTWLFILGRDSAEGYAKSHNLEIYTY